MPPPDNYVLAKMEFANLKMKEVKLFWKAFRRMDKNLSGQVQLSEFYKTIGEKRSVLGDAVFELSDCSMQGTLDFGEFFCSVVTFCLFEQEEILKYMFYIFDRDKNGYIEQGELRMMINLMYGVPPHETPKGNLGNAVALLDFNPDGKVDFKEFKQFHKEFPALFFPAFRIQVRPSCKASSRRCWLLANCARAVGMH